MGRWSGVIGIDGELGRTRVLGFTAAGGDRRGPRCGGVGYGSAHSCACGMAMRLRCLVGGGATTYMLLDREGDPVNRSRLLLCHAGSVTKNLELTPGISISSFAR